MGEWECGENGRMGEWESGRLRYIRFTIQVEGLGLARAWGGLGGEGAPPPALLRRTLKQYRSRMFGLA